MPRRQLLQRANSSAQTPQLRVAEARRILRKASQVSLCSCAQLQLLRSDADEGQRLRLYACLAAKRAADMLVAASLKLLSAGAAATGPVGATGPAGAAATGPVGVAAALHMLAVHGVLQAGILHPN